MQLSEWQKKLPMRFTLSRVYMVPLIIAAMWPQELTWNIAAAALFIVASVTDYYDGYFARKYGLVSNMGKFMDPIADKVLVTSVLVMLLSQAKIDVVMVILILARDNFISGIRSVAATDQVIIAAKPAGKWKTAMQMLAIPLVIIGNISPEFPYLYKIGYAILWISVILSITSGIEYFLGYLKSRKA